MCVEVVQLATVVHSTRIYSISKYLTRRAPINNLICLAALLDRLLVDNIEAMYYYSMRYIVCMVYFAGVL